jgi:hypothetical protein
LEVSYALYDTNNVGVQCIVEFVYIQRVCMSHDSSPSWLGSLNYNIYDVNAPFFLRHI